MKNRTFSGFNPACDLPTDQPTIGIPTAPTDINVVLTFILLLTIFDIKFIKACTLPHLFKNYHIMNYSSLYKVVSICNTS